MPELETLGRSIEYEVINSDEATKPRLDVDIHGVRVIVPTGDDLDPATFLSEHGDWVIRKLRSFERYRAQAPDRAFEPGERFPYLGEDRPLRIEPADEHRIAEEAFVLADHKVEQSTIKDELEQTYRRAARTHFEERCTHFEDQLGVAHNRLEIRNQRTRWASCSPQETLSFNWRLVMAPPDVVDYIVVHELAHLKERKHTTRFWDIVREHVPEYQQHAQWLTEHSARLIFDESDL